MNIQKLSGKDYLKLKNIIKALVIIFFTFLSLHIPLSWAKDGSYNCYVESVYNGDTFKCSNGALTKIWGIKAPDVAPRVSESLAISNGGNKARDYLKNYIYHETLICYPKGMIEGGNIAQCFKDLKVKTIDIADPLLIGKYVIELKEITKGYYTNPNRPRSE